MSASEIFFKVRFCDTLAGLLLPGATFFDILQTMRTFAITYKLDECFHFTEAETEYFGVDIRASYFLPGASSATCKKHIREENTMMQTIKSGILIMIRLQTILEFHL